MTRLFSEKEFDEMAEKEPDELVNLIENGVLDPSDITFAAESLRLTKNSIIAVPCLLKLLESKHSIIREGAIYGLEGHLEYSEVKECIMNISKNDISDGVREAAKEALE